MRKSRPACRGTLAFAATAAILAGGCQGKVDVAPAQRLIDLYRPEQVEGSAPRPATPAAVEWRFDGAASGTGGWEALREVSGLAVRQGRLAGKSTGAFPIVHVERKTGLDSQDLVHEVQVRMRTSAAGNLAVALRGGEKLDVPEIVDAARAFPWNMVTPLMADGEVHTYTVTSPFAVPLSDTRHVLVRPAEAAGGTFEIESVRIVTRREHLSGITSGVGWQGLSEVYRETIVSRSPEVIRVPVRVPARAQLDLAVGTIEEQPVTFQVTVRRAGRPASDDAVVLERTVTRPHRWEQTPVPLDGYAGQDVVVSLAVVAEAPNTLGFWGAPAVRALAQRDEARPQGVILIWADTLRRDHVSAYGYHRPTTPVVDKLAAEGVVFRDAIAQATWTKVATPSLMTSLYPVSHTVIDFSDRLPSSATTLAEVYRQAGYATVSYSSGPFTGKFTNLHQGFEEVHEGSSLPNQMTSKTARDYVDRLLPWLDAHRDVPFFVFLHITDPHDPFRPSSPYDRLWADPGRAEEHERHQREARKFIADPLLKRFGMPTREELVRAKVDVEAYAEHDRGWYDGSIRAMDVEIGRVVERLRGLGLERRAAIAFTSDHGEEFFEHGRSFHGQGVYGELSHMPLILWAPGFLRAGAVVEPTVQVIDVMPTLLDLSGLAVPEAAQGRTLLPLLAASGPGTVNAAPGARPAITEKAVTKEVGGAPPPRDTESTAIVSGPWKLIHNTKRPRGGPEFELYAHATDPLDRTDVAAQHPDVVQGLARELAAWRKAAERGRLKPDSQSAGSLSKEELERLRSLGYIQ